MSSTTVITREAAIGRWVELDAVEVFVSALLHGITASDTVSLDTSGDLFSEVVDFENDIFLARQRELHQELWGGPEDMGPEELAASIRSEALVARAFAMLATDRAREMFLREAAYFAGLVAAHGAELASAGAEAT
jgi:hypothetical protein